MGLRWIALLLACTSAWTDELRFQDDRSATDVLVRIRDQAVELERLGRIGLDSVRSIVLAEPGAPPAGSLTAVLARGDRIHGSLAEGTGLAIDSPLCGRVAIDLRALALLELAPEPALPETEPSADEDVLYVIGKQGALVEMRGAAEAVSPAGVSFFWTANGKTYRVPRDRVRALRMRQRDLHKDEAAVRVHVVLSDGSRLRCDALSVDGAQVELGYLGDQRLRCNRTALARVEVESDQVLYLSAAKPTAVERDRLYEHGPGFDHPDLRTNATIYGGPLDPQTSGIGTYGTTRLSFALRRRYRTLKAVIWVATPPEARPERAPGSAIFRVYVDGVVRFETARMRPTDPRQAIEVDVSEGSTLTLEVSRGDDWGVGHAGTWGDLRVIK